MLYPAAIVVLEGWNMLLCHMQDNNKGLLVLIYKCSNARLTTSISCRRQ